MYSKKIHLLEDWEIESWTSFIYRFKKLCIESEKNEKDENYFTKEGDKISENLREIIFEYYTKNIKVKVLIYHYKIISNYLHQGLHFSWKKFTWLEKTEDVYTELDINNIKDEYSEIKKYKSIYPPDKVVKNKIKQ